MSCILLAGRPGSGKTEFCHWLEVNRGIKHLETDDHAVWAAWAPRLLVNDAIQPQATHEFAVRTFSGVVVEWGFMPQYLPQVRLLARAGFDAWFFDADEPTARQLWRARRPAEPWEPYEAQNERLQQSWRVLTHFYRERMIRTVEAGPVFKSFDEIAAILLPSS